MSRNDAKSTLYEKLVFQSLGDMHKGYLRVLLPDGRTWTRGTPGEAIAADLHVIRPDFFKKCVMHGDVGFGESYVDGDWETSDLTALIRWMILNIDQNPSMSGSRKKARGVNWLQMANKFAHWLRPNNKRGSRKNIEEHYDLSNAFFSQFLDSGMTYSSAYFRKPDDSLEEAQKQKFDALCQKLKFQPGDRVLEIGCGWGGFAEHAARNYGVSLTGITISQEQFAYAKERIQKAGLQELVDIRFQDYRDVQGTFDKVVSIEMLEAVGHEFLELFFRKVHQVLKPSGAVGLQVITCPDARYDHLRQGVDWIQKHIFPGSLLPSVSAMQSAISRSGDLMLHHLENLAPHYVKTLEVWRGNLNARRDHILSLGFSERFLRKWNYYFSYCEAAFAMRNIAVLQLVYTRPNNPQF